MASIDYEDETCRIVTERNVGVISWREAPNMLQLRAHDRIGKQLARAYKGGTLLVSLVRGGTPNFTPEVRDETNRILGQRPFYDLGVARVLLVGGLGGVAARAFLSTALLVSRSPRPTRVFSNVADAAGWCCEMLASGTEKWTRSEIERVCVEAGTA
jgi:hypothetical protein